MKKRILQQCDDTLNSNIKDILKSIGQISQQLGEKCYVAGGLVRDCLMGQSGKDIDLVCSDSEKVVDSLAKKENIWRSEEGVEKTSEIAKFQKFGTYQTIFRGEEIELVDPRKETYIYQLHQPESVVKGTFLDDVMRRDFTVNSLYLGIQDDDWMEVLDLSGKGLEDLEHNILRTPKDPDQTFRDDPSRLFRLARFQACKGFDIEKETFLSAQRNAHEVNEMVKITKIEDDKVKTIVRERVPRDSVQQMMDKGIVCKGYLRSLDSIGVLSEVIPEVEPMKDCEQDERYHTDDVWEHTLKLVDTLPSTKELKWAGLFHDIGKPSTYDKKGNFYKHEIESDIIAKDIMTRLRFSNDDIRKISNLVLHHMEILSLISLDKLSDRALRHFAIRNDGYESDLIELAYADTKASGVKWKDDHKKIERLEDRLKQLQFTMGMERGKKFELQVTGWDIMNILHIKPSERVGEIRNELTEKVIDGKLKNEREELLSYLKTLL